jgi:hypothetical protein
MTSERLTIEHLERWVLSGAHWHVVEVTGARAVVQFCECTGSPVERLESNDREVIAYLQATRSDLDL